jgi:hypothetical protein
MERLAMIRGGEEMRVVSVRHLAGSEFECVDPHAMDGPLVFLAGFAAHQKPALGNAQHSGLN